MARFIFEKVAIAFRRMLSGTFAGPGTPASQNQDEVSIMSTHSIDTGGSSLSCVDGLAAALKDSSAFRHESVSR